MAPPGWLALRGDVDVELPSVALEVQKMRGRVVDFQMGIVYFMVWHCTVLLVSGHSFLIHSSFK
jgi:hypothetical protein